MCARRSGNILFYFFADNFTGSKDTECYKTDVSFLCQYTIDIKLIVYIQQNSKVQLQETMHYNEYIYFSSYANCSLITYQPNRTNLVLKNRSLKDTTKALLKRPQND